MERRADSSLGLLAADRLHSGFWRRSSMAVLQLRLTDGRGRPIRLTDDPITMGRHPDNRLRIKNDMASRHHAVIEPAPEYAGYFKPHAPR